MESTRTVLLIDDDADAHQMIESMLAPTGKETLHATNGWESLSILREVTPDLILLDLLMPGMDGFQFVHTLEEEGLARDVPIIVVTALDLRMCLPSALEALPGARTILSKPFTAGELLRVIDEALTPVKPGRASPEGRGLAQPGNGGKIGPERRHSRRYPEEP